MLAAFLPPYPFRGAPAPYLWCYYRLLKLWADEPAFFIIGRDYVRPVNDWAGRWECDPAVQQRLGYDLPSEPQPKQHHYAWLDEARFESWLAQAAQDPLAAFKRFLTESDDDFEQELRTLLAAAPKAISAIVTPCNVPALSKVCAELCIAVIHIELGALRGPLYYETAYVDFKGVNGNTESAARYQRLLAANSDWQPGLTADDLHRFFIKQLSERAAASSIPSHDLGVVLQVEDDSNLLAFAHGFSNLSLLSLAEQQSAALLVRPHPGSRFALREGGVALDDSCHSLAFLQRCQRLITINSSVGLEAMLLDKPVQVLGDNAFNFILEAPPGLERQRRLAFYLFGYLVPYALQLCPDYLRFRLGAPCEQAIILRHLSEYMKQQQLETDLFAHLPNAQQVAASVVFANQHKQHKAEQEQAQQAHEHALAELQKAYNLLEQHLHAERDIHQAESANWQQQCSAQAATLVDFQQALLAVEQLRDQTFASRSWRITRPLRFGGRVLRGDSAGWQRAAQGTGVLASGVRKSQAAVRLLALLGKEPQLALKGARFIRQHGVARTFARLRELLLPSSPYVSAPPLVQDENALVILTTAHCHYLAQLMQDALAKVGMRADIIHQMPAAGFSDVLHFVICPQMFTQLPGVYVAYQMEQSVSSRWFTPEYLKVLEHAYAVFDYSLRNVEFLQGEGLSYKQLYYLPVGYRTPEQLAVRDECVDVLFYGDVNNERRQAYIKALQQEFSVKVVNNLFGEPLYAEMAKAKVVVNIHYYEGALLETTRLYECLSQQQIVVSEEGSDMEEHVALRDIIDFVPVNDINAMVERVRYWVGDDALRVERRGQQLALCEQNPNWFEFYFLRFLLASELISYEQFYAVAAEHIRFKGDFICLGLPETPERRRDFERDNHYGIEYFPGLRHRLGWVGCGMSYKFLLQRAQDLGLPRVTICEDDVEFYAGFAARYQQVLSYLDSREDWDLFAGLIAQLHDELAILDTEQADNERYLFINKMVSMVMNVYSARFYPKLLAWDPSVHNADTNTIDRYIECHDTVRAITTPHFLVGHKEELNSTLWGFNNQTYIQMIADSETKLQQLLAEYDAIPA